MQFCLTNKQQLSPFKIPVTSASMAIIFNSCPIYNNVRKLLLDSCERIFLYDLMGSRATNTVLPAGALIRSAPSITGDIIDTLFMGRGKGCFFSLSGSNSHGLWKKLNGGVFRDSSFLNTGGIVSISGRWDWGSLRWAPRLPPQPDSTTGVEGEQQSPSRDHCY